MLDLNDEETLRFGYVHEQKGCEQSSTLRRERKEIIFRFSDHQDSVESKFIVCFAGSGKHSCQAYSKENRNYRPDRA